MRIAVCDALPFRAEAVPEINERIGEFGCRRTMYTQVRIAPLGSIERANIIAANKANDTIHNHQFAVIQRIAAWIENIPGTLHGMILHKVNGGMKGIFEGAWHDEVAESIKDDIHLHALGRLLSQALLKLPADSVAFPEICFDINALARRVDGLTHRIVEILPIDIQLEAVLTNLHLVKLRVGKALIVLAPPPYSSDNEQDYPGQDLQRQDADKDGAAYL